MISLPYPWLPAFFHETDNIAAMLVSEAASLVLTGFCYYMVYRYFSRDEIAKSMGIDVDCSLLLPYPCGIRDIDICIVLSNALDNAIHAAKNLGTGIEKHIRVFGRIQGISL